MTHAHDQIAESKYETLMEVYGFRLKADEPVSLGGENSGRPPTICF